MTTNLIVNEYYLCHNNKIAHIIAEDNSYSVSDTKNFVCRIDDYDSCGGYRYVAVSPSSSDNKIGTVRNGLDSSFDLVLHFDRKAMPYRGKYCTEEPQRSKRTGKYTCPQCGIQCTAGEHHPQFSISNPDYLLKLGIEGTWYRNVETNTIVKVLTFKDDGHGYYSIVYMDKETEKVYSMDKRSFEELFVLRAREGDLAEGDNYTKLSSGDTYTILVVGNKSSMWKTQVAFRSLTSGEDYIRPASEFLDKYVLDN